MPLAAIDSEDAVFLVISVLGLALGSAVYLTPGLFDAATRMRLRAQGMDENDEGILAKDRSRRRFIALVLCIGSAAILATTLSRI